VDDFLGDLADADDANAETREMEEELRDGSSVAVVMLLPDGCWVEEGTTTKRARFKRRRWRRLLRKMRSASTCFKVIEVIYW
jgi:hypothetical protein